jgi:hypothetical protein
MHKTIISRPGRRASRRQLQVKKKQGREALLAKIVSTLLSRKFDLILFGGATLLVRVRVPPETWTIRPVLSASLRLQLLDHPVRFVINFGNDCSNFAQFRK